MAVFVRQRVGDEFGHIARRHGRVAEGAGDLVVSRANLQLTGHYGTDAAGRPPVHDCRQVLARGHETRRSRPARDGRPSDRQSAGQAAQVERTS